MKIDIGVVTKSTENRQLKGRKSPIFSTPFCLTYLFQFLDEPSLAKEFIGYPSVRFRGPTVCVVLTQIRAQKTDGHADDSYYSA